MLKSVVNSLALLVPPIRSVLSERNELRAEVAELRADLLTATSQLSDALRHANGLPVPPRHLQERVVGGYVPGFIGSGTRVVNEFDSILQCAGKHLGDFSQVLDFGVGCGRVIRRFHELYPEAHFTGADIDQEAISWLQENCGRIGRFVVLPHMPPSELESEYFNLVYAVSVFTHLNKEMQFAWLGELQRITKRTGYLLLTVHGKHYQLRHPSKTQKNIDAGFYFLETTPTTAGLPSFYRAAFHTKEYVLREWSSFFDIIAYKEQGVDHQDLILCRKR
jgi:ubiquinone/menaquinone biosynthesis C-methylase UbiE